MSIHSSNEMRSQARSDKGTKAQGGGKLRSNSSCLLRPAFTLTEILIVIGIIVLLIAVSLPAFNLISGGRSIEGATNQLSAALGRARAEAIGLQKVTGVMLFLDPKTQRRSFAIVQEVDQPLTPISIQRQVWLDLVTDGDFIPLPVGVGCQLIDDAAFTTSLPQARTDDGYIGLNTYMHFATLANGTAQNFRSVNYLGAIVLFDGSGNLVNQTYGFQCSTGVGAGAALTSIGQLILGAGASIPASPEYAAPEDKTSDGAAGLPLKSQFGLVLYALDDFNNAGFVDLDSDPQVFKGDGSTYTAGSTGVNQEFWLDSNATPLMINRYTGAIVKGE